MKPILIKATVPDDFKDDGIRIYDTGSGVYIPKGQYEIIEPPSEAKMNADIISSGASEGLRPAIRIGMNRMLQILGL